MKLAGAALVFLSAGSWCLLRRREERAVLTLARALLEDLAVLSGPVGLRRVPRRELVVGLGGRGAVGFWRPLLERLGREEASLPRDWAAAAAALPEPLGRMLAPLGTALPAGGARLERAVEETREELAGWMREETARQADRGRVRAALCLSGACLAVLVLL